MKLGFMVEVMCEEWHKIIHETISKPYAKEENTKSSPVLLLIYIRL